MAFGDAPRELYSLIEEKFGGWAARVALAGFVITLGSGGLLGLGLFVSTISSTQQQAMMTTMFFLLTPMIYLSGFIFPIENMPAVIQPITYLIPLRYFIVIVRGIFLKGVGVAVLWPQILALLTWGVVIVALAVARSRKTLA